MAEIIMTIIFIVGMLTMIMFGIESYRDGLTESQKGTAKLVGAIVLITAVANVGKVLGLWGD